MCCTPCSTTGRPEKTAEAAEEAALPNSSLHGVANDADNVLTPKAAGNPIVAVLKAQGLYKSPLGSGKQDMICPWVAEHTDGLDTDLLPSEWSIDYFRVQTHNHHMTAAAR